MSSTPSAKPPFDLKSTAWVLTALRLYTVDAAAVAAALQARFADSPGLFDDDPLVLDLAALHDAGTVPDFAALLACLRQHRLLPVAAQGGSDAQMAAARAAGLVHAAGPVPRPGPRAQPPAVPAQPAAADAPSAAVESAAPAAPPAPGAQAQPTLVVERPLRSGQRVYARGGDLVVLAAVSFGAEVIADGHVHVYAPLRGRAIAGARGDTRARIFSTCMEPQLVSIAGIYRTTELPLPDSVAGQPAQVRLEGEKILVEPLNR